MKSTFYFLLSHVGLIFASSSILKVNQEILDMIMGPAYEKLQNMPTLSNDLKHNALLDLFEIYSVLKTDIQETIYTKLDLKVYDSLSHDPSFKLAGTNRKEYAGIFIVKRLQEFELEHELNIKWKNWVSTDFKSWAQKYSINPSRAKSFLLAETCPMFSESSLNGTF